jgi:hypothetical protein
MFIFIFSIILAVNAAPSNSFDCSKALDDGRTSKGLQKTDRNISLIGEVPRKVLPKF